MENATICCVGKRNDLLRFLLKIAKNRLFLRSKRKYFDIMKISIKKIKVGGITNIKDVEIPMEKLTALVAPNNYGKSNFLVAIEFAVQFMAAQSDTRLKMMSTRNVIPINKSMEDAPFSFEMEGCTGDTEFVYGGERDPEIEASLRAQVQSLYQARGH